MCRLFALLFISFVSAFSLLAQTPSDNPVRSFYGRSNGFPAPGFHWTDSIRWNNVVNIQDYRNLVRKVATVRNTPASPDSAFSWWFAFEAAQTALCNSGGGVVYFPALPERQALCCEGLDSAYYFHESLFLRCQVIIRGQGSAERNARNRNFAPATYFEFPRYEYSLLAGTGRGTSNRTAFKAIAIHPDLLGPNSQGFSNIGVVNVDINRARILFHPRYEAFTAPTGRLTTRAVGTVKNVVVMGVRSNNATYPAANVPTLTQNLWQRWPESFSNNINVLVNRNVWICNNRINDLTNNNRNDQRPISPDDFFQNNYIANVCTTAIDGADAVFSYTNVYGIMVNRLKTLSDSTYVGFLRDATPVEEPNLYAPNVSVCDNWIFKKSRVGIQAGGSDMDISRNEIRDDPQKSSKLNPGGTACQVNAIATYENRGIDFTGWNINIEDNDVEFYRTRLTYLGGNAFSSDGEGIYFQGVSGSLARGITIRNNRVKTFTSGICNAVNSGQGKGFNGFTNTKNIMDVLVEGNDLGHIPLVIDGQGTGTEPGILSNVRVLNNRNVGSISMIGCGFGNVIAGNTASDTTRACYFFGQGIRMQKSATTCLDSLPNSCSNNTNPGFGQFSNLACPSINICGIPLANNLPRVNIENPAEAEIVRENNDPVSIEAAWTLDNCDPDSIVLFVNDFRLQSQKPNGGILPNPVTFDAYRTQPTGRGLDRLKLTIYQRADNNQVFANESRTLRVVYPGESVGVRKAAGAKTSMLYPNPAKDMLHIQSTAGAFAWRIVNLQGKIIQSGTGQGTVSTPVSTLPAGIYLMQISQNGQGASWHRFEKE